MTVLFRNLLGEEIRQLRQLQGRTQADVAAAAGCTHSHLSEIERGKSEPRSYVMDCIFQALDVRPSAVFRAIAERFAVAGR